jgi:rubrerythrin
MRKMTEENLQAAFSGESQAHMRYLIFADKAEGEGRASLARLLHAIAYAEQVHATNHYRALQMIRSSTDNLQVCIDGENYEVEDMYPAYKAVAELQSEKGASQSFNYAMEAEKIHAMMYQEARQTVLTDKDIELKDVYICPICGHTVEGEAPDRCPICGATKDKFRKF